MMQNFHIRHAWFFAIFLFCAALVLANVVHYVIFRLIGYKESKAKRVGWGLRRYLGKPARTIFLLSVFLVVLPVIPSLPEWLDHGVRRVISVSLILSLGWFAVGCIYLLQNAILRRYDLTAEDNMQARRVHTQFQVFRRLLIFFVVVIDAGLLLWSFDDPRIWHYGSGLLASAGVASLLLAAAAKSTASNFLAGLQIALTQPIRIDDVVVVQGENGRIEEINSAYVVVRLWDLRRLIVPLSYFIENTYQNWTRESADLIGTSLLYVDYSVPVEVLRKQLNEIVKRSPLWDGELCALQVTNLSERAMELRCLTTARSASESFDLRCVVREEMTAWIQKNYPTGFPIARTITLNDSRSGAELRSAKESGAAEVAANE